MIDFRTIPSKLVHNPMPIRSQGWRNFLFVKDAKCLIGSPQAIPNVTFPQCKFTLRDHELLTAAAISGWHDYGLTNSVYPPTRTRLKRAEIHIGG